MAVARAGASVVAEGVVPLSRNRPFGYLWAGSAIAFVALFEVEVAVPLVLLYLTGSAGEATLFAVTQAVATVVVGVPAGHLLDRLDRRRVLVAAEASRSAALASVVAALLLGHLTVIHLLLVAGLLGSTQAFGTARMLLIRAVVPPEQFTAAVTAEEVRNNAAELAGPPIGGLLFGFAHALPFVFGAVAFLFSTILALLVEVPARDAAEPVEKRSGVFAGLDTVLRDPAMQAAVILVMLLNGTAWPARLTTIILLQQQGTPSWQIGVALAGMAVGGLAGTLMVSWLHRVMGPGTLLLLVGAVQAGTVFALSVGLGPVWAGVALFVSGLGIPAVKVLIDVLIVRQIPDAERGRALSGVFTLFGLVLPVALAGSGLMIEYLNPHRTLVVLGAVMVAVVAAAAARRPLRRAQWPSAAVDA